ncbi:SWIM zinc finger family protein [Lactiplantibacillus plajomi]|uniref:SWIM zinc finger domain-containing protein n=1 Tax=Lactiplantibacillus plajomi TaxID=1457217 RepID=A0ABV6K1E5_9LACO|nr:SWIM zinc finger family protein [Lactiplantibacillus plajomi]
MINWKKYFHPQILQRGKLYYQHHWVKSFVKTQNGLKATVIGNRSYHVSVNQIKRGHPQMNCDCPYFKAGHNCKHLAAVFYQYDLGNITTPLPTYTARSIAIPQHVHSIPGQIIIDFFDQVIAGDSQAYNQFEHLFFYKKLKNNLKSFAINRRSFWRTFDRTDSALFAQIAAKFMLIINRHLESIKSSHQLTTAFDLTTEFYLSLLRQHIDNTSSEVMDTVSNYSTGWLSIYENADDHLRAHLFNWLCDYAAKLPWTVMAPLQDLLFEYHIYEHPSELQMKLIVIDNRLAQLQQINHDSPMMLQIWQVEWVRYRVDTISILKLPLSDIKPFCETNQDDPVVMNYFLNVCRSQNNRTSALNYINLGIQTAPNHNNPVDISYAEWLLKRFDDFWGGKLMLE